MQQLRDLVQEYGAEALVGLVSVAVGAAIGRWRARRKWESRDYLDRLNVSLNSIDDGVLLIRTVREDTLAEVFLNAAAAEMVTAAARRTTPADPILPIPAEDVWFLHNSVLNQVSEQFAAGLLHRDMGLPVKSEKYLLTLTCERAGKMRTQKVRAMLVRQDLLTAMPETMPRLESANHETRWNTLKQLAAAYAATPDKFLAMELCMPTG